MKILTSILISFMLLVSNGCNESERKPLNYPIELLFLGIHSFVDSGITAYNSGEMLSGSHEHLDDHFNTAVLGDNSNSQISQNFPDRVILQSKDSAIFYYNQKQCYYQILEDSDQLIMAKPSDTISGAYLEKISFSRQVLFAQGGFTIITKSNEGYSYENILGDFSLDSLISSVNNDTIYLRKTKFLYSTFQRD